MSNLFFFHAKRCYKLNFLSWFGTRDQLVACHGDFYQVQMVNFSLYRSVVLIGIVQMTSCRPRSPCPSKHYWQWLRCCRWASFNTWAEPFHRKGNSSCWKIAGFESWQHVCCASLQRGASMLKLKWQGNFTNYPVKTLHQRHHGHFLFNKTKDLFFYSHHKTGCMLVDSLLHEFAIFLNMKDFTKSNIQGVEHVGYICKSFLLKTNQERSEARKILKPRMISTLETAKLRFMAHFDRAPFAPVSTALTLKVHVVRPPSHLVVSGYLYHLKGLETWLIRQQPPDCLSCDYFAWVKIFEPCHYDLLKSWWVQSIQLIFVCLGIFWGWCLRP